MKNKIIYVSIFLIAVLVNMHVFTDVFGDTAIPKVKLYGTSTYWADSTNYQTTNKSVYIHDSLKVGKDLYVGVKGGNIYMDTSRQISITASGSDVTFTNSKRSASEKHYIGYDASMYQWFRYYNSSLSAHTVMELDSATGLLLYTGNIQLYGGTQQIKIPKDTVSDYTSADAVTLNRQQGVVTTKSLTTASGSDYTITVNNSLVSSSTNVWAMIKTNPGTGAPIIRQCATGSGTITIIIRNLGSGSLNSAISFQFIVFN